LSFVNPLRGLKEILHPVSSYLEDGIGSDLRVGKRNLNRMIGAELVIPKDMFSS
jgi:UDP-glucose 6-dehydrogenase